MVRCATSSGYIHSGKIVNELYEDMMHGRTSFVHAIQSGLYVVCLNYNLVFNIAKIGCSDSLAGSWERPDRPLSPIRETSFLLAAPRQHTVTCCYWVYLFQGEGTSAMHPRQIPRRVGGTVSATWPFRNDRLTDGSSKTTIPTAFRHSLYRSRNTPWTSSTSIAKAFD